MFLVETKLFKYMSNMKQIDEFEIRRRQTKEKNAEKRENTPYHQRPPDEIKQINDTALDCTGAKGGCQMTGFGRTAEALF